MNELIVLLSKLLYPYNTLVLVIALIYMFGSAIYHLTQERNPNRIVGNYVLSSINLGFSFALSIYAGILVMITPNTFSELTWIIPYCACPFPLIFTSVIVLERVYLREALRKRKSEYNKIFKNSTKNNMGN